ncbi:MAG: hypothetical protein LBK06_00075 [Planctomycetaceae bacterium]|nr:hypothetical protein [Planctomycetaceae bacterium]
MIVLAVVALTSFAIAGCGGSDAPKPDPAKKPVVSPDAGKVDPAKEAATPDATPATTENK